MSPQTARSRRAIDEPYRPIAAALQLPTEHVTTIDQSHERCATLGLSRFEQPDLSPLGRADLTVTRERNLRLHAHAAPVMEMLHEQIVQTQSMVVLCDATGTIIHSIGDDDFLSRASKVALAPGVNWSEQAKGTNAIGTALVAETPTLVHADEHFMHANHFLTCSAAPILDPRGNILGVLDVNRRPAQLPPAHDGAGAHERAHDREPLAVGRLPACHAPALPHPRRIHRHLDGRHPRRHARRQDRRREPQRARPVGDERRRGAHAFAAEPLGHHGRCVGRTFSLAAGHATDRAHGRQPAGARHGALQLPAWHSTDGGEDARDATAQPTIAPPPRPAPLPRSVQPEPIGLAALTTGDVQMAAIAAKVRRVIDRDIPILILGETGTGKELLARAIHQESQRARQPFIAVNCASIPETLIESELFGYEEGAFTGARRKGAVGKILQADGGTLFLDEIGDMPIALQAHLLRVLQERQVVPLGSNKAMAVDVAIVCATHRNLREMIAAQTFREDLYYRLNGLAVRLPALRERSDLAALAERIVEREASRSLTLSAEVAELLARCPWPGNVRQLFNVLRTACVMAAGERTIRRDHLPDDFLDDIGVGNGAASVAATRRTEMPAVAAATSSAAPPAALPVESTAGRSLDDIEIDAIRRAVDAANGNISVAAKRLGISRNTIYRKLRWNEKV